MNSHLNLFWPYLDVRNRNCVTSSTRNSAVWPQYVQRVLSCHFCEPRRRFASVDKVFVCIVAWRSHRNKVFIVLLSCTKFIELVFKVPFHTSHKTLLYFTMTKQWTQFKRNNQCFSFCRNHTKYTKLYQDI